jgi:hypothetical protein
MINYTKFDFNQTLYATYFWEGGVLIKYDQHNTLYVLKNISLETSGVKFSNDIFLYYTIILY